MSTDGEAARVLRERARALAQVPVADTARERLELLEFRVAGERYAVETRHVSEVHPLRELVPLPGTPPFIRGVVNLRGRIVAVLDLRKFFALPEQGITDLHRIVVVRAPGLELGLLADVVIGVSHVDTAALTRELPTLSGIGAGYLRGVDADGLVVLDLDRVLADRAIVVDHESA